MTMNKPADGLPHVDADGYETHSQTPEQTEPDWKIPANETETLDKLHRVLQSIHVYDWTELDSPIPGYRYEWENSLKALFDSIIETIPKPADYGINWHIPADGFKAIEKLKRIRRSINSWEWLEDAPTDEETQLQRSEFNATIRTEIFDKLIETIKLETVCDNCSESIADCECNVCDGCDTRTSDSLCECCSNCSDCCECAYCEHCDTRVRETCSECERCNDCCQCVSCDHCGARGNPDNFYVCGDCNRCSDCCNCITCSYCGEHVDDTCSENGYCADCCSRRCDHDSEDSSSNGPRLTRRERFHTPSKKQLRDNRLRRFIGMEVEVNEVSDGDALESWASNHNAGLEEDGSLNDSGVEVVTSPSAGDIFLEHTASLADVLESAGASVNSDCGFHVHVDARDYAQGDLRRLLLLYTALEHVLFELTKGREDNNYSRPCGRMFLDALKGNPKEWRTNLHRMLYSKIYEDEETPSRVGKAIRQEKRRKQTHNRYNALNLHSYFFRKTIEWRTHEGTTDAQTLRNWSLVCAWIVETAYKLSERQLLALIQPHVAGNGDTLLCAILPVDVAEWVSHTLLRRRAGNSGPRRIEGATQPKDALASELWHTANVNAQYLTAYSPIENAQRELF